MDPMRKAAASREAESGKREAEQRPVKPAPGGARPVLPPGTPQLFVPLRGAADGAVYRPAVLGQAEVHLADSKSGVATTEKLARVASLGDPVDWAGGAEPDFAVEDLSEEPEKGVAFSDPGPAAAGPKAADAWSKELATWIYREKTLTLFRSPSRGEVSRVGEAEADFRSRLGQSAREERDAATDALRQKYSAKTAALQERLRRAEQAVGREKSESMQAGIQTAISVGATVLGALLGRKAVSASTIGRATTAARSAGRTMKQAGDVGRAEESAEALRAQIASLDQEAKDELAAREAAIDPATEKLETMVVRPKKTDVTVRKVALVWVPGRG
jgi:hypothetical protein